MAVPAEANLITSFLAAGRIESRERYLRFERLGEIFTWLALILVFVLVQLPFTQELNHPAIYELMAGIGIYALVWYRLIPKKYSGRTKNFISNLLTILLITFLVHNTGGVSGYTVFLYLLVGLTVGMSMPFTHTLFTVWFIIVLIFFEASFTPGVHTVNLSLALIHSWALCLVTFYARAEAGEASIIKEKEERTILEKEKILSNLKDEFVYIVSHELKIPITAVKGYLDKIFSQHSNLLDPESRELLELTDLNSNRLNKLLEDLLDISRIEQGGLQIKLADVSLQPLVNEVLSNLFLEANNKKITLSQEGELATGVKADPNRLKEILTNLVGNAIKYTPEGGHVIVSVKKEGGFAKISVTDNGIGISPADQAHLFEKFYRIENEQTKSVKGSGLGLFITKQLVEKMGGSIGVVSALGKGSTFYFTLPRYRW